MLKPANPNLPQDPTAARETAPEAPAGAAQTGDPAAPRAAETAPLHDIADSRSDPKQANRPYAQTVRGQIQREFLLLLAELLERRLREEEHKQHAQELQRIEQERQLHERERKQREELEAQLKQLGAQVDRLNSDLIRQAEEVTAAKATPELRDTVKPLLLAVLELLGDSDQVSADAAAALIKAHDTGRSQANTPGDAAISPQIPDATAAPPSAGERRLGKAATQNPVRKPEQTDAGQAVLGTPRPAAESTPWAGAPAKNVAAETAKDRPLPAPSKAALPSAPTAASASSPDGKAPLPSAPAGRLLGRSAARVPAAAAVRPKPSVLPETLEDDFSAVQEKSSLDDEVAIEIARLLKPQDSEADAETLSLDPKPDEQEAAAKDAPLLLGTSETPELDAAGTRPPAPSPAAAPKAPAAPAAKQVFVGTAAPTEPAKADTPGPDKAAATASVEARGAETRGEDAESTPSAHAPRPVPAEAMEEEPLPKCLTERWDDAEDSAAAGKSNPLDDLRPDKSSFRWRFRRPRSTIEQDQAMATKEQDKSRTSGASTDHRPAAPNKPSR